MWIVFLTAFAVSALQFSNGETPSGPMSLTALVALCVSGCALFIGIINYFTHTPIRVTVTSHAIRIDAGEDQMVIRLIDLIEIQRSHSWLTDDIVLKANGDREISLENLHSADEFLNAIVTNASLIGSTRRTIGRAATFSLVTKNSHLKLQEIVGRKKIGSQANSLELTNNFTTYLSTFPLSAILPSLSITTLALIALVVFEIAPLTTSSVVMAILIAPGMFLIVCYALFIEKQISINRDEVIIETSNERISLPRSDITGVSSRRAGLSRIVKIGTKTQGTVKLRGYSNPERIESAIQWVAAGADRKKADDRK